MSLLDEAHRRTKANMQAIERRLRLETAGWSGPSTESLLTSLQERVVAAAALHRDRCRSGRFDQIDLAVYLRRVASALAASMGRGPEETAPSSAGWAIDQSRRTLFWHEGPGDGVATGAEGLFSLDEALQFVPWEHRDTARRAICAVAVLAPPTLFHWRSPEQMGAKDDAAAPGQLSVRLGVADKGLSLEISLAEGSLGLPGRFETSRARASLEHQLTARLDELGGTGDIGGGTKVDFVVRIVSTWDQSPARPDELEIGMAS